MSSRKKRRRSNRRKRKPKNFRWRKPRAKPGWTVMYVLDGMIVTEYYRPGDFLGFGGPRGPKLGIL